MTEIISIISWVAAFFIACMFAPRLAAMFAGTSGTVQTTISNMAGKIGVDANGAVSILTVGVCFVALFVGTLLIGTIVGYLMTSITAVPGISFFNRILGGVFGFAKGYIINLVIIFVVQMTPVAQEPVWAQSQFVQVYQPAVAWLGNVVQPGYESLKATVGQTLDNMKSYKITK
ncbi:MAG: cvpA [Gammaproteobacteria bacterium]|nr:cvpA [Gammaproteobacteria bacterium]